MHRNRKVQAMATAAAAVFASHAQAQADDRLPVRVAVVDLSVSKLDFRDDNVRVVAVTPQIPRKFANRDIASQKYSHGDVVASAFVREYRKLEPTRPIVIYAVDTYHEVDGKLAINMKAIREAVPVLRENGVKVAVTAFGTVAEASGERFMAPFREAGITVFAAAPNTVHDLGIFPAASKGAISVSTEDKDSAFTNDPKMKTWVDFTISGNHRSSSIEARGGGNSFASAHAAAYGVYISSRDASISPDNMRDKIADLGDASSGLFGGKPIRTVRIGHDTMVRRLTASYAEHPVMPLSPGTAGSIQNQADLKASSTLRASLAFQQSSQVGR